MTTASHTTALLEPPDLLKPLQKAFEKVTAQGVYIFRRVQDGLRLGALDFLPKPIVQALARNPAFARTRVERALFWLDILHQTLKGSREHLRGFGPISPNPPLHPAARAALERLKAENRALRGLPPLAPKPHAPRPSTEDSRDLQRRARIRRILQHDSIGAITHRVCRGLGISPESDSWPAELATLSETPEHFLLRQEKARRAHADATAFPAPTPDAAPAANPRPDHFEKPPYHRRQ